MINTAANRAWVLLVVATGVTYWLGESGATSRMGLTAVWVMMGMAFVKGVLVIDDFMELRHASAKWRWFVLGWLIFVIGMIVLAYWIGLRG